jgi:hypothetical protein
VNTKYLIVDEGCYWEAIEALNELFPEFQGISPFALVVKAIDSIDGATFVVTSEKEEVLREFNFIRQHQTYYLKVLLSSIHVIT